MAITCCNGCLPPERNGYCHTYCEKYKTASEKHEKEKAIKDQQKRVNDGLKSQTMDGVRRAKMARKRMGEKYYG